MEERSNSDPYAKHFAQARRDIIKINRKAYGEKKRVIKRLAENLATDGMPVHTICSETIKRLQDIVLPRYARRCLDSKYKDPRQSSNAKKQAGKRSKNQQIASLAAHVPPLTKHEGPSMLTVAVDHSGRSSQDSHNLPHHPMNKPKVMPVADPIDMRDSNERKDSFPLARFVVTKSKLLEMVKATKAANKRAYLYFDENRELVKVEPDCQRTIPQRLGEDGAGELFAKLFFHGQRFPRK